MKVYWTSSVWMSDAAKSLQETELASPWQYNDVMNCALLFTA